MQFSCSARWLLVSAIVMLTAAQPLRAAEVSGNVAMTSDYVFRGISQTQGKPAPQAGLRLQGDNGAFAALWGSRVDYASVVDASAELDYVVGWGGKLGNAWVGEVNATYFSYPSTVADLDYLELIATATWRDRFWVMLGHSSDVFATGKRGVYAQVGAKHPLTERVRVELAGGYYALDDVYGRSYAHGQATLAWTPHPRVELRVTGHTTNQAARAVFGTAAAPRVEAAIQVSY